VDRVRMAFGTLKIEEPAGTLPGLALSWSLTARWNGWRMFTEQQVSGNPS